MKSNLEKYSVKTLIELRQNKMLVVNDEYQRGAVWSADQKKKLIDSMLRGYPIPILYLHKISRKVGLLSRDDLEIIDGQQRLNAIYEFVEGAFELYNPKTDLEKAKFPAFIRDQFCDWGGKRFSELSSERQKEFLSSELIVAEIESDDESEARDLFVRLQGGSALNAQERRDAWPGGFTDFILTVGGKPTIAKYPGHRFFTEILKMKPSNDRGKTRQLAAQIYMLFDAARKQDGLHLCDIKASSINDFYYDNLDFDKDEDIARSFDAVLKKLSDLISNANLPKLRGHDAIHAVLLVDALQRNYAAGWEAHFTNALSNFMGQLAEGKKLNDRGEYSDYWSEYGQRTRVNSDTKDSISRRHKFYVEKMTGDIPNLRIKDQIRLFSNDDKRVLFERQEGRCQVCKEPVKFDELEIHHIVPHSLGGKTELQNGAIVHPDCHPKSQEAVANFQVDIATKNILKDI